MGQFDLPISAYEWMGHLGVALYLGSYGLLQAGVLRGSGYLYTSLNLAAASMVLASLVVSFNLSSALIQVFWIAISIFGLTRLALGNYRARFSEEEKALLAKAFPQMPKAMARRLMNAGNITTLAAGHVFTTEGAPVQNLVFLFDGEVDVLCGGQRINILQSGFIGEMNVLTQGPASATVEATKPSKVFAISCDMLTKIYRKDGDFRAILDASLTEDTHRKLVAANTRLSETPV